MAVFAGSIDAHFAVSFVTLLAGFLNLEDSIQVLESSFNAHLALSFFARILDWWCGSGFWKILTSVRVCAGLASSVHASFTVVSVAELASYDSVGFSSTLLAKLFSADILVANLAILVILARILSWELFKRLLANVTSASLAGSSLAQQNLTLLIFGTGSANICIFSGADIRIGIMEGDFELEADL